MLSVPILGIFVVATMTLIVVGGIVVFALGSASTAKQQSNVDQPTNSPPLERDPSNPYAPASVGGRPASSLHRIPIAIGVFVVFGICLLTFAATYILSANIKTAPIPPAPIPATQPVLQPQSPPTSPILPQG